MPQPVLPAIRPRRPLFGSGPTVKRPGWTVAALNDALVGRSHRSPPAKARLQEVLERCRDLLGLPDDYLIGIVPASDTGAFELAMWTLLGARGVDVVAFDSFGQGWATDATSQLRLEDCRLLEAPYGHLPELGAVDAARDVVFTWNGTTSGVRVPDASWIAAGREGLTLCDATSAAFAMELEWTKLDATTFSFQKVLGGEAQHGVLILSPRAVERLETHRPPWPLPKIFRLTEGGRLIRGIFAGETINTPSMLVIEDALDALRWAEEIGGLDGLIARTNDNFRLLAAWVAATEWVEFLAGDPLARSPTSVCLRIVDPEVAGQPDDAQRALIKRMTQALEGAGVALDIAGYRDAPPGLRIWGGATVETDDLAALLPWLDWAYASVRDPD